MVIDPEISKEIVNKVTEIGLKYDTKIWIEFGTLLGYVRESGFLVHDRDIDFGIEYKYWNPNIISDLKKSGFSIRRTSKLTDDIALSYVGKWKKDMLTNVMPMYKNINIGFEIYHEGINEYKNNMYFWPPKHPNWIFEIPKKLIIPQKKVKFYDLDIWIPEKTIEYIEFMYGENWKIPIVNYIGSKTHKENSNKFRRYFNKPKIAFFPGKFHPPHLGHLKTLIDLSDNYDKLIIGVSEHIPTNAVTDVDNIISILKSLFKNYDNVEIIKIKGVLVEKSDISDLPKFDILISGNEDVLLWAKKLKIPNKFVERSEGFFFSGTEIRNELQNS